MRFEELKPRIQSLTYLDKGWRGIVYRGFFEGKEVAIKVAKSQEKEYAIPGLGIFAVRERAARKGRNPRTGDVIDIPARKVVVFKPAKDLREGVK